jgi:phosphoglycolate phosphatase-like HAD superfamily hydrolase
MLFLFDIDGTLLRDMPPAHRMALCDAAEQVFAVNVEPRHLGKTAGMTDSAIARRMLLEAGVTTAALSDGLPAFFAAAADAYDRLVSDNLRPYLTPYAMASLEWLRDNQAVLGLVTGNIERIAWRKLAAAGADGYFSFGAFGDEAELRDELPPRAIARAEQITAQQFAYDEIFVVGDTPADIACGAASQLRTIAVATGPEHSLDDLHACQPDYIFPDLSGLLDAPFFRQTGTSNRAI